MAVLDRSQVHVTLSDLGGALGLSDEVHALRYNSTRTRRVSHSLMITTGNIWQSLANWETLIPDLAAQLEMKMIGGVAF
ncbi:MAG: hypothetical protein Ct9H300mP8_02350 [Gammaproteobacteria bacterium]|nr:MAG: hypothetical protein Ct9H300mP8_02350 [Gammaproteobacteria bacterium]